MTERRIAWMDMQDGGERGAVPTLWDSAAAGRVKVGVSIEYDQSGQPVHFHVSSDDNHVQFCEQFPEDETLGVMPQSEVDHRVNFGYDRIGHD